MRKRFDPEAGLGLAGGEKEETDEDKKEESPLPPFAKGGTGSGTAASIGCWIHSRFKFSHSYLI
jgi:hypothetical protein